MSYEICCLSILMLLSHVKKYLQDVSHLFVDYFLLFSYTSKRNAKTIIKSLQNWWEKKLDD